MYVLDTDILATANRRDFPLTPKHEFWEWLVALGSKGELVVPEAVYNEIGRGDDELPSWLNENKKIFFRPTEEAIKNLPIVVATYGNPMPENTLELLGADPYVIAHAYAIGATVLSNESPRPGAVAPKNKKIPSICKILNIPCQSLSRFIWEMKS